MRARVCAPASAARAFVRVEGSECAFVFRAGDSGVDSPARGAGSAAQREADELADLLAGASVKESEGASASTPVAEAVSKETKDQEPSAEAAEEAAPSAATKFAAFRAEQRGAPLTRRCRRRDPAKRP